MWETIGKMFSPEKEANKRKRKEAKRRDANAIERRRIQEFNEALRRLREVTKHITIDNKKKGRKVTKLTTIRAAIKHIYGLKYLLQNSENKLVEKNCLDNEVDDLNDITKHQRNTMKTKAAQFANHSKLKTTSSSADRSPDPKLAGLDLTLYPGKSTMKSEPAEEKVFCNFEGNDTCVEMNMETN